MYTFNNAIENGDIILVRGAAKHSAIIAKMTNGHFSHAMVYLGNGRFLEAITKSGVQVTSHVRISVRDKKNVVVLRCNFDDLETKRKVHGYIAQNYASYQGRAYSYIGAAKSITKDKVDRTAGSYFCSHLVASLYSDAGVPLLKLSPHKVKPNDLLESKLLVDVTTEVLGTYSEETLKRMERMNDSLDCIDDSGTTTLSKDALSHQTLLKNTKKYFTRVGLPQPAKCSDFFDVLTDPRNARCSSKLDHQICREYKKLKINSHLKDALNEPDFYIDMDNLKNEINDYGYDYAKDTYNGYNHQLTQFILKHKDIKQQSYLVTEIHSKFNLKYTKLKVEYYELILQMSQDIIDYLLDACKYIEDAFSDKQHELQDLKLRIVAQTLNSQAVVVEPEALLSL
ncbi:permuted papain-like amidase YaeF/Yiix C92 family enzyme [Vibrio crassostreae]|uniref:hypothetical protein n=1 Tax=Vibrio crassostreae TaxID=246167 RepID=UPI00119BDCD5|nr:hypothetical protein [Vibrio crassostreae]TWD41017.1 permuted papain-like amidase YaeF/Yiix C92 family enzyme [Vibrio crassostreae]